MGNINMLDSRWSIVIQLVLVGLYLLNRNLTLSMWKPLNYNYCFDCDKFSLSDPG